MRQPRPKPKHHLRETTDPQVIERIQRSDLADPIGGQHGGKWYVDTKLGRKK